MSQPYFINYQRGLANTEICQNYVKDLIVQIRNTNMHNAPSHLTRGDKIKDCLKYVKQTIIAFEKVYVLEDTEDTVMQHSEKLSLQSYWK